MIANSTPNSIYNNFSTSIYICLYRGKCRVAKKYKNFPPYILLKLTDLHLKFFFFLLTHLAFPTEAGRPKNKEKKFHHRSTISSSIHNHCLCRHSDDSLDVPPKKLFLNINICFFSLPEISVIKL